MSNMSFPLPTPLRQAIRIDYQWGDQKFEILASACSIRTAFWEATGKDVTWLHCTAVPAIEIDGDGMGNVMNVLIPVHYITKAEPGPKFRVASSNPGSGAIGIFPPNQPAPANPVRLAELDSLIGKMVDVSLN